ncbi:hypothetical protein O4H50_21100 [Vibrio diazotrophicus]|uniref:hypothetical protein n=1 Tax=Vibrio diazotrophicus TaxID=685 RepID=UPI0022B05C16|nr:hypothetical protein [Vibrio diazotrophicus]MCZ4374289.1 hypothetical protein [Vibrio diazotrophicus]
MNRVEQIIRSTDVKVRRDTTLESTWLYGDYEHMVEEALSFHCPTCKVSDLLKLQISQLYHQGYVVIENIAVAVPVTSVLSVLDRISDIGNGRGKLRNISDQVGFKILHTHFGQSSFIVENWANHAKRTKLQDQDLDIETMYQSLIASVSNNYKTGEWVVYSKHNGSIIIWCLWLHEAGDEALVRELKART